MLAIRDGEWNLLLLFVSLRYKYYSSIWNVILPISGNTTLTKEAGK